MLNSRIIILAFLFFATGCSKTTTTASKTTWFVSFEIFYYLIKCWGQIAFSLAESKDKKICNFKLIRRALLAWSSSLIMEKNSCCRHAAITRHFKFFFRK